MTPAELLENVKQRFNPLLVREEPLLSAFLRKALAAYQDRAGVIKYIQLQKAGGTSVPLPADFLALVHVTDANGGLVYSDPYTETIEIELCRSDKWPLRLAYLVNLRDTTPDEYNLPPEIVGSLEDYLEALINVPQTERLRRVNIANKFDASNLPDESTLYQRVVDLEEKMSSNRAIIPGATILPG